MPPKFSQMVLPLKLGGQDKFLAIPPGHDEGAVRLHRDVGKIRADGIGDAGKRPQIRPEKRIGIDLVLDQCRDHRRGHGHLIPILGLEGWGGKGLALGVHFAGRLQGPAVAKRERRFGVADGSVPAQKSDRRKSRTAMHNRLLLFIFIKRSFAERIGFSRSRSIMPHSTLA